MSRPEEFRHRAFEAVKLATQMEPGRRRDQFLELAQCWHDMADAADAAEAEPKPPTGDGA